MPNIQNYSNNIEDIHLRRGTIKSNEGYNYTRVKWLKMFLFTKFHVIINIRQTNLTSERHQLFHRYEKL